MSILAPFQPKPGSTVNAASGASQDMALDGQSKQYLVTNVGTAVVFVRAKFPDDTTAATNADCPVAAGTSRIFSKAGGGGNAGETLLAMFGAAGSTVYVTSGEGWA
jgi:hypothetical protein